jgi:hypothetical protein
MAASAKISKAWRARSVALALAIERQRKSAWRHRKAHGGETAWRNGGYQRKGGMASARFAACVSQRRRNHRLKHIMASARYRSAKYVINGYSSMK